MKTECNQIHTFKCTEVLPALNEACSTIANISAHLEHVLDVLDGQDISSVTLSEGDVNILVCAYIQCETIHSDLGKLGEALGFVDENA